MDTIEQESNKIKVAETEKPQQITLTLFNDSVSTKAADQISLDEFVQRTKTGYWKEEVEAVREAITKTGRDTTPHQEAKKRMPAITLSAECSSRAANLPLHDKLTNYNHLLQIDYDLHEHGEKLQQHKEMLAKDPHIAFVAISPSGDGIKAAIAFCLPEDIQPEAEEEIKDIHKQVFVEVDEYLYEKYKFHNDEAVKDLFRLCFVLYDPDIIINEEVQPLPVKIDMERVRATEQTTQAVTMRKPKWQEHTLSDLAGVPSNKTRLQRFVEIAMEKVRTADQGSRHDILLQQARLIGGYIAGSGLEETTATEQLLLAVKSTPSHKSADDEDRRRAIKDGIAKGKEDPLEVHGWDHSITIEAPKGTEEAQEFPLDEMLGYLYGTAKTEAELLYRLSFGNIGTTEESWWFYRDNGLWNAISKKHKIFLELQDKLEVAYITTRDYIRTLQERIKEMADISTDLETKARHEKLEAHLEVIKKKKKALGSASYHRDILHWLEFKTIAKPFNSNPLLLHCSNGTWNEETGTLQPHSKEDYITITTGQEYQPEADCPKFKAFIRLCLSEFPEHLDFTQKDYDELYEDFGYILSRIGSGIASNLCILNVGEGNNGKSLAFRVIGKVLGDYYAVIDGAKLLGKDDREISIWLDLAENARLLNLGDLKDKQEIGSEFKRLVGDGERKNARVLYKGPKVFDSKFITVGHCNKPLRITEDTHAIRDRFKFFPWCHQFPEESREKVAAYEAEYLEEGAGIFRWIIECVLEWKSKTHTWSNAVLRFNRDQYDLQVVEPYEKQWFRDSNYEVRMGEYEPINEVYEDYLNWCASNKVLKPASKIAFRRGLPVPCQAKDPDGSYPRRPILNAMGKPGHHSRVILNIGKRSQQESNQADPMREPIADPEAVSSDGFGKRKSLAKTDTSDIIVEDLTEEDTYAEFKKLLDD